MRLPMISGVILAGGRSRRMGEKSKPLQQLGERTLIEWVVANATPQVNRLLLSVNAAQDAFRHLNLPVIADQEPRFLGPLAGIASAMQFLLQEEDVDPGQHLLACFAADVPWFPANLVSTLHAEMDASNTDMTMVSTGTQLQPLFSLWRLSLLPDLQQALQEGLYGPKLLRPRIHHSLAHLSINNGRDFFNVNTPEELAVAQKMIDSSNK